jgi:hypothetical protein
MDLVVEETLNKALGCSVIHSMDFEGGLLMALKLKEQVRVDAIDRALVEADDVLKAEFGGGFFFRKISSYRSGLSKTFGFGDCEQDVHFKAIFATSGLRTGGKALAVNEGVMTWTNADVVVGSKRKGDDGKKQVVVVNEEVALRNQLGVMFKTIEMYQVSFADLKFKYNECDEELRASRCVMGEYLASMKTKDDDIQAKRNEIRQIENGRELDAREIDGLNSANAELSAEVKRLRLEVVLIDQNLSVSEKENKELKTKVVMVLFFYLGVYY